MGKHLSRLLALLTIVTWAPGVVSIEIEGVFVAPRTTIDDGSELFLNGAGVRKKLFLKVYVAALYVQTPSASATELLSQTGPNRVRIHVLHTRISKQQITEAIIDGFEANAQPDDLVTFREQLASFGQLIPAVVKDDVIDIDYLPGTGTRVTLNDAVLGEIDGATFNRAVRSIWLGERPVTRELKAALLGAS